MAVQTYGEVPGMSREAYEGMVQQLEAQLRAAPGFIAHIGGPTASGWAVSELWESQADADAWLQGNVLPMVRAAGMPAPQVQSRPVHKLIIAGR